MRALLIVALVVLLLVAVGWITVNRTPESTNIRFETQEMKQDTQDAIREGKEFFRKAGDRADEATQELRIDTPTAP